MVETDEPNLQTGPMIQWFAFLGKMLSHKNAVKAFCDETGHDLESVDFESAFSQAATGVVGPEMLAVTAYADWITINRWGVYQVDENNQQESK